MDSLYGTQPFEELVSSLFNIFLIVVLNSADHIPPACPADPAVTLGSIPLQTYFGNMLHVLTLIL